MFLSCVEPINLYFCNSSCLLVAGIQFRLPTSCSVDRAQPPPGSIAGCTFSFSGFVLIKFVLKIKLFLTNPFSESNQNDRPINLHVLEG